MLSNPTLAYSNQTGENSAPANDISSPAGAEYAKANNKKAIR